MSSPSYGLWVAAQAEALAAEKTLIRDLMQAGEGGAPPVAEERIAAVKQMRWKATALLNQALIEMEGLAAPGPLVYLTGGHPTKAPAPSSMQLPPEEGDAPRAAA
jgi:hypothetical protein